MAASLIIKRAEQVTSGHLQIGTPVKIEHRNRRDMLGGVLRAPTPKCPAVLSR
jgi:hypothetical protein